MANYFNLTLDTTGPANPTISLNSGATYAVDHLVDASISTADGNTTGYQMKLWGDIDLAWGKSNGVLGSSATGATEADALWISYLTTKQLRVSSGDGSKTVNLRIRDDVHNASGQASDSITLDTTRPVVTISGPDVVRISKQTGKDSCNFSFSVDSDFNEYKVKVVSATGAAENTGTTIGTAGGSSNMSGTGSTFPKETPINCTIKGSDLETTSSGDGAKVIKVFVKDLAGHWSI